MKEELKVITKCQDKWRKQHSFLFLVTSRTEGTLGVFLDLYTVKATFLDTELLDFHLHLILNMQFKT